jgi:hypothetical protein
MIRQHNTQPAFAGGEMSPLILGRHDTERFLLGGQRVENFIARHQGPLVRRRGTQWIRSGDCPAGRLVNFERSCTDAEMLQIGCGNIVVGAVVPASPPIPATVAFSQYDGPFEFESHLLEGLNEHGETVYFRSAYVSGENRVKGCQSPNSPGLYPYAMGDGVTNLISGLCTSEFSGGYQMWVDDPSLRDPVDDSIIVTDPLQCDVTKYGQLNAYNFSPTTGVTETVGASTFSALLTAIAGVGGLNLFEVVESYTLPVTAGGITEPQYVFKYITRSDPGIGSFPTGPMSFIWHPGYEVDYRYTNMVTPADLGIAVARTGTAARTQHITSFAARTYQGTMSKAVFTVYSTPGATEIFAIMNFTVTPDVGDAYTLSLAATHDVTGVSDVITVNFPVINAATVHLTSWAFSHEPQVYDGFEDEAEGTEVFTTAANGTWDFQGVTLCPAPNCGCHEDFEDESTEFPTVTALALGYGWAAEGTITSVDPADAYDEFESYTAGELSNFGGGMGWAAAGYTNIYRPDYAAEAFETYSAGAITTFTDNSDLWGIGWSADGSITS